MSPWQHFPQREECIMATAKIVRCSKCARITASNEDDVILSVNDLSVHCPLVSSLCVAIISMHSVHPICSDRETLCSFFPVYSNYSLRGTKEESEVGASCKFGLGSAGFQSWSKSGLSTKIGILVFSRMDSVYSTPQQEFKLKGISCIDIWVLIPGLNLYAMYCILYHVISLFRFIRLEH